MKAIEVTGTIEADCRVQLDEPLPPGRGVRVEKFSLQDLIEL